MQPPKILYVEDNFTLRHFVRDVLDMMGWHIYCASDRFTARLFLKSDEPYDLLLLDNELHNRTVGLELVKLARRLPRRKQMPIILFSIEDCAAEAQRAGVNAFIRKPTGLHSLLDTVKRLLDMQDSNPRRGRSGLKIRKSKASSHNSRT